MLLTAAMLVMRQAWARHLRHLSCQFKVSLNHIQIAIIIIVLLVPPIVIPLTSNQLVVSNLSEPIVMNFRIDNAIPSVVTSDIHWYYASDKASDNPDFASCDMMDITNMTMAVSSSALYYSQDLLTLTINPVQSSVFRGVSDSGRYYMSATNVAGEDNSFIDSVVLCELIMANICNIVLFFPSSGPKYYHISCG